MIHKTRPVIPILTQMGIKGLERGKTSPEEAKMSTNHLIRRGMTRFCFQSIIAGPTIGCLKIHWWSLGEPLSKQNAEKMAKGIVGSTGKKIPTNPMSKLSNPKMSQKGLTIASQSHCC